MKAEQQTWSFDDMPYTEDFTFGKAQGGFDFGASPQHSKDEQERRRRNAEENFTREKRKREEWQREEARQREQKRKNEEKAERDREERARRDGAGGRRGCPLENAWEVLGVSYAATGRDIRQAWAAKMKTAHPDVGGNAEDAKRYNAAYNQLKGLRQ